MQHHATYETNSPLFDDDGFANYQVIGFFLNQISDRVYSSNLLKEKIVCKSKEIDKLLADFKAWIKVLQEWEYMKIEMDDSEEMKSFIKEKEDGLAQVKNLLIKADTHSGFLKVNEMKPEEFLLVLNSELYVTHTLNGFQRWGLIIKGDGGLLLNSLSLLQEPNHSKVISSLFDKCTTNNRTTLFLDLKWNGQIQTRLHIDMTESIPFQMKFADRCVLGREGTLFKGSLLSSVLTSKNTTNISESPSSSSTSKGSTEPPRNVLYEVEENIFALTDETFQSKRVLGIVTRGLSVLQMILSNDMAKDVIIEETGMIIGYF